MALDGRKLGGHAPGMRTLAAMSLFLALALPAGGAVAQQKVTREQLIGTWTLTRVDNVLPDGTRVQLYGANPQGVLTFDADGRYTVQILRSDRARFASSDKNKGTPEENKAAVQGSNSHFGRYSVNEAERTLTFHIDHASFPNWEGTEQKRSFTLVGDELKYTVPAPTTGGTATGEVSWRRAVSSSLAGTWTLSAADEVRPDGTRLQSFGANPRGLLIFDDSGRYSLQIFRPERAKFASGNKLRGTAAEYESAVLGMSSHVGRYSVDFATHTLTFQIELASYPNWDATEQKRPFELSGDELRYQVPATASNGTVATSVWHRVR